MACRVAFVPVTTVPLTCPSLLHFFQNSLIKRIEGENVYVRHSNLMLEVGIGIYQCMLVCGLLPRHPCGLTVMHDRVLSCWGWADFLAYSDFFLS